VNDSPPWLKRFLVHWPSGHWLFRFHIRPHNHLHPIFQLYRFDFAWSEKAHIGFGFISALFCRLVRLGCVTRCDLISQVYFISDYYFIDYIFVSLFFSGLGGMENCCIAIACFALSFYFWLILKF